MVGLIGLRVSPHFDKPWTAKSVAAFWNKHWDLAAGERVLADAERPGVAQQGSVGMEAVCDPGASSSACLPAPRFRPAHLSLVRCPAGNTLRQLVYDVVCDGSLLPPAAPQGRPSHTRQALGSLASFAASGLVHEGIFW